MEAYHVKNLEEHRLNTNLFTVCVCVCVCVRALQCEIQSDQTVFRVRIRTEEHSPGSTPGLHSVESHGLSDVGGFCQGY